MQSIYGFRNAEVGRFSTVRDGGLANVRLEPLELRRNFRSAPALVHWCNELFARVFPRGDDLRRSAVRHLASVGRARQIKGEPRDLPRRADGGRGAEAQRAAATDRRAAARPPRRIDRGTGQRTYTSARDSRGTARSATCHSSA